MEWATRPAKVYGDAFNRAAKLKPELPSVAESALAGRRGGEAYTKGFASGADRGLNSVSDAAQTAARNLQNVTTAATGAGSSIASSLNPVAIVAGAGHWRPLRLSASVPSAWWAVQWQKLSGALGLLPGLLSGVAAGFGTAKIATLGFGDAISDIRDAKKFAEGLKNCRRIPSRRHYRFRLCSRHSTN